jgi:hypothetical protein
MFKKIKIFELEDLKGRNLDIKSLSENTERHVELIIAADTASGEIFILKQIIHPVCASVK